MYEYGVNFKYATVETNSPEENATFNVVVIASSEEEARKMASEQVVRPIVTGHIHKWSRVENPVCAN